MQDPYFKPMYLADHSHVGELEHKVATEINIGSL